MKITDHTEPRVRIIEDFLDLDTCKFIVNFINEKNLWRLAKADPYHFKSLEFYRIFSKQWDERKVDLNNIFADESNKELMKILWEIKEKAKLQVEDFFDKKNSKVFLEGWEVVRWFYPYMQMPHIDYLEPDFDRKKDLPKDFDDTYLPEGGEEIYLSYNTTKHYTSMLYLNEDFKGGDLYFPFNKGFEIKPKRGMLVIFSGDFNTPHGVTQITDGTRYVHTAFWTRHPNNGYYVTDMIENGGFRKYWES